MHLRLTKDAEYNLKPSEELRRKMNVKNDHFCRHIINESILQTRIVKKSRCKKSKRKKNEIIIKIWDYPAVAITSYLVNGDCAKSNFSREVFPDSYNEKLTAKLNSLEYGKKIGDNRGKTMIGHCAEPHAANQTMNEYHKGYSYYPFLSEVYFSEAKRPRTMEKIPTCQNCKDTFPKLK